ncbi:hypothetical protein BC941DRAFT_408498 [Chlamydoabsidia padenii]|nr:hypothetical protein BC941DRAFT_408498 [Chlamydoabsidia padenii]
MWKWWKKYKLCWKVKLLVGILGYKVLSRRTGITKTQILLWRLLSNSSLSRKIKWQLVNWLLLYFYSSVDYIVILCWLSSLISP